MSRPKFIDDLAGVASGAMSALTGISEEIEQRVAARMDEAFHSMRLVRREEFDAALEMAANARAGQEDADRRLAEIERRVAAIEGRYAGSGSEGMDASLPGSPVSASVASVTEATGLGADEHLHGEGGLGGPPAR